MYDDNPSIWFGFGWGNYDENLPANLLTKLHLHCLSQSALIIKELFWGFSWRRSSVDSAPKQHVQHHITLALWTPATCFSPLQKNVDKVLIVPFLLSFLTEAVVLKRKRLPLKIPLWSLITPQESLRKSPLINQSATSTSIDACMIHKCLSGAY